MVRYGVVRHDVVCYRMVWYGMEARRRLDPDADYSVADSDCGPAKRHSLQFIIRANNK